LTAFARPSRFADQYGFAGSNSIGFLLNLLENTFNMRRGLVYGDGFVFPVRQNVDGDKSTSLINSGIS